MKILALCAGLLLSGVVAAATPRDFASAWPLAVDREGAWAVVLDGGIYDQVTRTDMADLAAFNADGEELAFGPLPPRPDVPNQTWREAVWFALPPAPAAGGPGDLQLHVTRAPDGSLHLDSSLTATRTDAATAGVQDLLIDVRGGSLQVAGVEFTFANDAADFAADIAIDSSDDLRTWQPVVAGEPLASFRHGAARLLHRTVEFTPRHATYLRLHASQPLPIIGVRQRVGGAGPEPPRLSVQAVLDRRDGNVFYYRLPLRIAVERVAVEPAQDNTVATFTVAARADGQQDWLSLGALTAYRLRSQGVEVTADPLAIAGGRWQQWRLQAPADAAIASPPTLRLDYRPETWIVLTHGRAPYTIVAGSRRAQRGAFPLAALVASLRAHDGPQWTPPVIGHGARQLSAGPAALHGWDTHDVGSWMLWIVLGLGAVVVAAMVVGALRAGGSSKP